MCADTKTLRVDRAEGLGSPGAATVSIRASLRECKEQKGAKKRGQTCLQRVKKTLLKGAAKLPRYC